MKRHSIFAFTILILCSCTRDRVKISSDFDRGSIGKLEKIEPGYFKGPAKHWLKRDSIGDQYYWFYFKAENIAGKTITFELTDLDGVYRGNRHLVYSNYTQPVYSYDQKNWTRIADIQYDSTLKSFTFKVSFDQEPVWIAYAHPYSYERYKNLIQTIQNSKHINIESIAESPEGRDIQMITITDKNTPPENKKHLLFIALQHSGEDAGGYYAEGMINYLLSDNVEAANIRKKFVYKFVPMMNPDGIYNGITRYNANMEDLNNIWLNEGEPQPEVSGLQQWLNHWYANGNQLDLFIDIHNHSQFHTYNLFFFKDNATDSLFQNIQNYWPVRLHYSGFSGSAQYWFSQKGIPSGTLELTQSKVEDGDYLTIKDYYQYGEGTIKGIHNYYFPDK